MNLITALRLSAVWRRLVDAPLDSSVCRALSDGAGRRRRTS
ncbi:hypothetical protein [Streptomyces sp. NBC_01465]|nr:hypothetical protein [Streptomyces sp. NBC_01465]